ncbi:MAG: UbiA family prenyltransferase [Thermoplasmata archaeon]|nr:UbiA family prenyltransferase [Thermoplasmata archaeon]
MLREKIEAYKKAARLEYSIAEFPGVIIPVFIALTLVRSVDPLRAVEAISAFLLLYLSGFLVNSLSDLKVDEKYKRYVAEGVRSLGRRNLIVLLVIHLALALLLTVHLSILLKSYIPLILYAIGVFFGIGYSVEPLHFKVKGILHPIALGTSAFFIPFLFLTYTISGMMPPLLLPLGVGFTLLHYGIALTNQAQDLIEDRDTGVLSPAVRWGLGRTLKSALLLFSIGFLILLFGLFFFIKELAIDPGAEIALFLLSALIVVLGYLVPLRGMGDLYRISMKSLSLEEKIAKVKKRLSYPRWQASGLYSLLFTLVIISSATRIFPPDTTFTHHPETPYFNDVSPSGGGIISAVLGEPYRDDNGTAIQPIALILNVTGDDRYFLLAISRCGGETFATLFMKVTGNAVTVNLPVERPQTADINITLLKQMRPVDYLFIPATKSLYISHPVLTQENSSVPTRATYRLELEVYNDREENLDKGSLIVKVLFSEDDFPAELKISINNNTLRQGEKWNLEFTHQGGRDSKVTARIELYYRNILVDQLDV